MMKLGILLFETAGERLPGDPGYPGTFEFPVKYGVVEGSYRDLIEGSEAVKERLLRVALSLEKKGVTAIAGDCGLMALYQRELAEGVRVPVLSSSLVLLPLLQPLFAGKKVGILTGHSEILKEKHLRAAGAKTEGGQLAVWGMQTEPHFKAAVIDGTARADYERMKDDVFHAAGRLLSAEPSVGALLLECSNLTVFSGELKQKYGLPVFDVNTGIYMMREAAGG